MAWSPSPESLAWGARVIQDIGHGRWLVTRNGFYAFDHEGKSIVLFSVAPTFDVEQWEKHQSLFAALGYSLRKGSKT